MGKVSVKEVGVVEIESPEIGFFEIRFPAFGFPEIGFVKVDPPLIPDLDAFFQLGEMLGIGHAGDDTAVPAISERFELLDRVGYGAEQASVLARGSGEGFARRLVSACTFDAGQDKTTRFFPEKAADGVLLTGTSVDEWTIRVRPAAAIQSRRGSAWSLQHHRDRALRPCASRQLARLDDGQPFNSLLRSADQSPAVESVSSTH